MRGMSLVANLHAKLVSRVRALWLRTAARVPFAVCSVSACWLRRASAVSIFFFEGVVQSQNQELLPEAFLADVQSVPISCKWHAGRGFDKLVRIFGILVSSFEEGADPKHKLSATSEHLFCRSVSESCNPTLHPSTTWAEQSREPESDPSHCRF